MEAGKDRRNHANRQYQLDGGAVDRARQIAEKRLADRGITKQGRTDWTADQQLAPRPVLFPNEVRDSPPDFSIIIRPGRGNFRLKRFAYLARTDETRRV
jgi:type IV secretory pathway TraG/TraD family ATPase VirD4